MSDEFEDQLKAWLRQRAGDDRAAVEALAGNVATLPPRRARPNRLVPLAAGIAVVVAVAWLLGPRLGTVTNTTTATPTSSTSFRPGDPAAFANDPRLAQCPLQRDDVETVFEMSHARDYQRYLPSMGLSPELDVDAPALVVVYREGTPEPPTTGFGAASTPLPGTRIVCVVPTGQPPNVYVDVDIAGLTLDVAPSTPQASAAAPTPDLAPSGPTPSPAPAWYAGAEVLLQCDGEQGQFGKGWQPGDLDTSPMSSGQRALANLLDRVYATTSSFPATGFRLADSTADGEVYTYTDGAAIRAVVVTRSDKADRSGPWRVTGVAACEPGELGPDLPSGAVVGIWRDPTGSVVPSDAVSETADCYHGRKLRVDGRLFVWDPDAGAGQIYDPAQLDAPVALVTNLPGGVRDTGDSSSGRRLFLAQDGSAAFVVSDNRIEQWPHVKGDDYQRTDCN